MAVKRREKILTRRAPSSAILSDNVRNDHRCNIKSSTLSRFNRVAGTPTEFNELLQSSVDAPRAASNYKNKPLSLEAARCSMQRFRAANLVAL